jgi:tetratricopeptide (TPR) repeat protein
MSRVRIVAIVVAVVSGWGALAQVAHAQQAVWEAFHRAGDEAHKSKSAKLALQMHTRALEEARREELARLVAESAARLGEISYEMGDYSGAHDFFMDALKAFETHHATHPNDDCTVLGRVDVVRVLNGIAGSLQKQGKNPDAERYLRHAIRIVESRATPDPAMMLQLVNALAHCLYSQGDRIAAHALVKQGIVIAQAQLGTDHHAAAVTGLLHAALLSESGEHGAAAAVAHESLNKVEKVYGADHPRTAGARLFSARMHHLGGADEEARKAVAHARNSLKSHYHDTHPVVSAADELHRIIHETLVVPGPKPLQSASQSAKEEEASDE